MKELFHNDFCFIQYFSFFSFYRYLHYAGNHKNIVHEFISFKGLKTFSMEQLLKLPRNRYKNLYITLSCSERLNIRNTWKLEIIYSWNIGNLLFQRTLRMFMYIWPHPTKPIQSNCSFYGGLSIYKI